MLRFELDSNGSGSLVAIDVVYVVKTTEKR